MSETSVMDVAFGRKATLTSSTFLDVRMLRDPFSKLTQWLRSYAFIFAQLVFRDFFELRCERTLIWIIFVGLCFQIRNEKIFSLQHWKGKSKVINHDWRRGEQWKSSIVIIWGRRTCMMRLINLSKLLIRRQRVHRDCYDGKSVDRMKVAELNWC